MESNRYKWGTLISCSLSCFVAWIDFAIVNTALVAIQTDLKANIVQLQWVMNAFLLALTVLIVTIGRLSDIYGRRLFNILGVAWFGLFSFLAGIATTVEWLIFCRLMQGVASAAIIPSSLALITHAFPPSEKGKAFGIWSGVTGLGMALGPVLGGIFVSLLSWRWIFYINVPFAFASVILSLLVVKESHHVSESRKIDLKGLCLMTIGLTALVMALIHAPDWGWLSAQTISLWILAVISLIWFYFSEKHSSHPTIPVSLFRHRMFLCCTLVLICLVFGFTSALFLMPLYLQKMRLEEGYVAGLMLLSITACIAIFSPFIGRLVDRMSAKKLILIGLALFGCSTLLQIFFQVGSSPYFILAAFILLGLGWAFARNPATTMGIAAVPPQMAGMAAGVLWTLQNIGGSLSIAIVITVFRRIYESSYTATSFMSGYHVGMGILTLMTLSAIGIIASAMKENQPANPKKDSS